KMKKISYFFIFLSLLLVSAACNKDDDTHTANPIISLLEVGVGNNHTAYIGSDLHIEAEVFADGLIETIEIEIHSHDTQWEFHHIYTEFSGQRNANFHKHIDIPQEAEPGEYRFHFIVTDRQGQSESEEIELSILAIEDEVPPNIN